MRTIVSTLAIAACVAGCAGTQVSGAKQRGFIVMDVKPSDAQIYVDGRFMGSVDGWAGQTVVVDPGSYMLELRAPGYITQRFDVAVARDEEVTLKLQMEPVLEETLGEEESK